MTCSSGEIAQLQCPHTSVCFPFFCLDQTTQGKLQFSTQGLCWGQSHSVGESCSPSDGGGCMPRDQSSIRQGRASRRAGDIKARRWRSRQRAHRSRRMSDPPLGLRSHGTAWWGQKHGVWCKRGSNGADP